MKNILQKIPKPIPLLVLFVLFSISIVLIPKFFMEYMYSHKLINFFLVIFYFIPGLFFFSIASINNFLKNKIYNSLLIKIISLIPVIAIILYFLYAVITLLKVSLFPID
ncbi:hypothetical protein EG340_18055 [Chryseobacterium indoltheticum]|uniref:Uncharacterized protein n=1 Tax=Chryseobacterium indoltheticum TaxID=254 RepID=A0A3G6NA33_9FLAO|nr:hypothetical protein EG340_18055 [Chryseobacterium indoltheticum]